MLSGAVLNTVVRYTRFDSDTWGQGPADMQITPEGWGGNFFNTWSRRANQVEVLPAFQLPSKTWHGRHEVRFGEDVLYRSYNGSSVSHPVDLLAQDGSLAEQIAFQGAGLLRAADTEAAEFVEDQLECERQLDAELRSASLEPIHRPRRGLCASRRRGLCAGRRAQDRNSAPALRRSTVMFLCLRQISRTISRGC